MTAFPTLSLRCRGLLLAGILSLAALSTGALSSTVQAAEPTAAEISAGPPAKATPATPGWGYWAKAPLDWQRTLDGEVGRARQGGIDVLFVGDSITQGWGGAGKALWEANYAPLKAVNFGIGGDSTRQVLWRLDHGIIDGIAPKVVVVAIGTNNLYNDQNSGTDEEIAAGVKQITTVLRARLPQAKLLVLGMLPRQNAYFCDRIARINALVAKLDDGAAVRFLDPGAAFISAPGTVKPELYRDDQVHLTAAGYAVFDAALHPLVEQLLH